MHWTGYVALGLAALGTALLVLGYFVNRAGRSADESLASVIPYTLGAVVLSFDLGFALVVVIVRAVL